MVIIPLTFVIVNCKFIQFPYPAFVSIATISELAARKSGRKMEVKPDKINGIENKTQPNYALLYSFVFFIPLVVTWNEISTFTAFFQNVVLASPSFDVLTNIFNYIFLQKSKSQMLSRS